MSEIHNPVVVGTMTLDEPPTDPQHAVRLEDLSKVADEVASRRSLVVVNVTPTAEGNVGEHRYVAGTVPANNILSSVVADTKNIRVTVHSEGTAYKPPQEVFVNEVPVVFDTEVGPALFSGYADLTLEETGEVIVTAGPAETSVHVTLELFGPALDVLTIGVLPGDQTAAKENDLVQFTAITANTTNEIVIKNQGAAKSVQNFTFGQEDSAGTGLKTVTGFFKASNRTGEAGITAYAVNKLGTHGQEVSSVNTILLDQTFPQIANAVVTYPEDTTALKTGAVGVVAAAITEADSVTYTSADYLSVDQPNVYAETKDVTLTEAGKYHIGTDNVTITATRANNGAVTVKKAQVNVASAAVVVTGTVAGARLRTSPEGNAATITIKVDQTLQDAIILATTVGEIAKQPAYVRKEGSLFVYEGTIKVTDGDAGTAVITSDIVNMAGVVTELEISKAIGGFLLKELTVPAFSQIAAIGVNVVDINKVQVRYTDTENLLTVRHDLADVVGSFTIVDEQGNYSATGDHLFLSDRAFAGANTLGTLSVDIEEIE